MIFRKIKIKWQLFLAICMKHVQLFRVCKRIGIISKRGSRSTPGLPLKLTRHFKHFALAQENLKKNRSPI